MGEQLSHGKPAHVSEPAALGPPAASPPIVWSPRARLLVTALLGWHLVGLIVGPISVPPSIVGERLRKGYLPYLQVLFLNHGYKFFGPDPGPSHLVRYEWLDADGEQHEGLLPSHDDHWPRLLYHRHFMLSEFVQAQSGEWNQRFDWEHQPLSPTQEVYVRSYANHLLKKHDARRVSLFLVEHRLPLPDEVLSGMKLSDPRLYRSRKLGTFHGGRS